VTTEQVVELKASGRTVRAPVLVLAGHADGAVTLSLGFGQSTDGIADGVGTNAYPLRAAGALSARVTLRKTPHFERIARTQEHDEQHNRDLAPSATLAHYTKHPDFLSHLRGRQ